MQIILTHTGSPVPEYTEHCIRQLKYTNPDKQICLITHEVYGDDFKKKHLPDVDLCIIPIEDLEDNYLLREYRRLSWFKAWGKPNTTYPSPENFVHGTSERLFLLLSYLEINNATDVWHFENDNLVYVDLDNVYLSKNDKLTICHMGPKYVVFNAVHIPTYIPMKQAMEFYLDKLSLGNERLCKEYDIDMAHEMTVMVHYNHFNFFPSIPDELSMLLFDPASYGQFVAGTNCGHGPGFLDTQNHDIAKAHNNKWKGVFGHGVIDMKDRIIPLANLHMHNKTRIKEFATYE